MLPFEVLYRDVDSLEVSNLEAIDTPTYKLAKFLVLMLEPRTTNEYTIKDSFTFAEELQSFDSKLVMASLDIESLFSNIPLQETIDLPLR